MPNFLKRYCLLLLISVIFLSGCAKEISTLEKGEFPIPKIKSVIPKITDIDQSSVSLEYSLNIYNPYDSPIKSGQFVSSLKVLGKEFLTIDSPVKANIKSKSEGKFTVPVKIPFASILNIASELKNANKANYLLKGALIIPMGNETVKIPVEKKDYFPIFRLPEIQDLSIKDTKPSLFSMKVDLQAIIKNTNTFPLNIENIRYAVYLGEFEVAELKVETDKSIKSGKIGKVSLKGSLSAVKAFINVMNGSELGAPRLEMSGSLDTPYGKVTLNNN